MGWIIAAGVLAVLITLFVIRSEYEKRQLTLKTYEAALPELPEAFDGLKVLYLSDLHGQSFGERNGKLTVLIEKESPDLILLGGDMVTVKNPKKMDLSAFEDLLSGLPKGVPVYLGNGNHETRMLREAGKYPGFAEAFDGLVKRYGVRRLSDETASFQRGEERIFIAGFDLPEVYYRKGKLEDLKEGLLPETLGEPKGFTILLLHSPLYMSEGTEWGANLVLSGHFHGGTIYLPKIGGLMTPQYGFFEKRVRGAFPYEHGLGIVSPGLGTHSIRIRFNDKPEVTEIILKKQK